MSEDNAERLEEESGEDALYTYARIRVPSYEESERTQLLPLNTLACLRGEHEVGAVWGGPHVAFFGADAAECNAGLIKFCRHCRCLFVEKV